MEQIPHLINSLLRGRRGKLTLSKDQKCYNIRDMNDVLPLLAVLFGIAGSAGGAVGYFAKGRADAVIALSAKEIELLKDANTRLEKENAGVIAERDRLTSENATLAELAKGSQLSTVAKDMREYTRVVRDLVTEIKKQNGKK